MTAIALAPRPATAAGQRPRRGGRAPALRAVDEHIGARLRDLRIRCGLSQERLGEEIGLTFQQVQKYERGANRVSGSMLWRLAEVLDVTPGYFFEELRPAEESASGPVAQAQRMTLELVRAFHDIADEATRRAVFDLAKSVARASRGEGG